MSTNKSTSSSASRRERRAADRAARKGKSGAGASASRSGPSVGLITAVVLAVGVLAVVGFVVISGGLGGNEVQAVSSPEDPPPPVELRAGRSLGDPEAPVHIEVFEDPQCPACGIFSRDIEPLLIAGRVRGGDVHYTYRDMVFLGPESLEAAIAMRAAEALDGKFWEFRHVLFHNQDGENDGAFSTQRLADMAELVGLDRETFLAELEVPEHAEAVQAETSEAAALGVDSTPTLRVNGELIRGVPRWQDLDAAIEEAIATAQAAA